MLKRHHFVNDYRTNFIRAQSVKKKKKREGERIQRWGSSIVAILLDSRTVFLYLLLPSRESRVDWSCALNCKLADYLRLAILF